MEIIRDAKYRSSLKMIMEYIAQDSVMHAIEFQLELDNKIDNLENQFFLIKKKIVSLLKIFPNSNPK